MRTVALLAAHNEERFIGGCIEHLLAQGLEVYLLDDGSTDRTVEIAETYLGRGLVDIESLSRTDMYSWAPILDRKAELAARLDADWFMHVDPDEIRLPPRPGITLAEALAEADRAGYNAVNFLEFTFVPTLEEPDHDHPRFQETMRWYYPFLPRFPHRLNAWKKQTGPVDLSTVGGHEVRFEGLRMYPHSFAMRHYLFLSVEHAIRKYVQRRYDPTEMDVRRWHRVRDALQPDLITLRSQSDLREYSSDADLDASNPLERHLLFADAAAKAAER
jgi:glycosyltransferase involved in cell wall biosynthesis